MNPLDIIKAALPFIGTALGGPLGGGAATFIASKLGISDSTIAGVKTALTNALGDPVQLEKAKEAELEYKEHCLQLGYDSVYKLEELNAQVVVSVNTTMQAEAKADHWPTYTWRPFIGFITGIMVLGCYFVLPLAKIPVPTVPDSVWLMLGGILGVASYFRGKAQADPNIPTDNRG